MDGTLFEKAVIKYNYSEFIFVHFTDAEGRLGYTAYNVQQSIKLAIRYILSQTNIAYMATDTIEHLILVAEKAKVNLYLPDYIRQNAKTLSDCANYPHVPANLLTDGQVESALDATGEYLRKIRQQFGENAWIYADSVVDMQDDEFQKMLDDTVKDLWYRHLEHKCQ